MHVAVTVDLPALLITLKAAAISLPRLAQSAAELGGKSNCR